MTLSALKLMWWLYFAVVYLLQAMEKCCPKLGCFDLGSPWTTLTRVLPPPRCLDEIPVFFHLYTRPHTKRRYNIQTSPKISLRGSNFDGNKFTVFFFHGWQSDPAWKSSVDIRDAYLNALDLNVIMVDWSYSAENLFYPQSASDIRVVAAETARLADYLIQTMGASASRMHIIGQSLGAQAAGYTARAIPGTARLTGLDPAGPLFDHHDERVKINKNDAVLVDVLHSNGHPVASLGSYSPMGDVDFYFNGGTIQPGCRTSRYENLEERLTTQNFCIAQDLVNAVYCCHVRSILYYTESLNNKHCTFWGYSREPGAAKLTPLNQTARTKNLKSLKYCTLANCEPLGLKTAEYPGRGSFEVVTKASSPFCIKHPYLDSYMEEQLNGF